MADFEPRRARPGERFGYTSFDGKQVELAADDEGIVRPKDAAAIAVLDAFGVPIARKVVAEEKAAEPQKGGK